MLLSGVNCKNQNNSQQNRATNVSSGSAFRVYNMQKEASNDVKIGVGLTTLLGVTGAMLWTFKEKRLPVKNIKDFFKNLVKVKYNDDEEIPALVTKLALCSVGGGLLGGALFDKKENMPAKYREAIIQLIGNVATPLLCVGYGGKLLKEHVTSEIAHKFKFKKMGENVLNVIASGLCLVTGIFAGNKIGNLINQEIFNINDNRKLKLTDMSPHLDDACLALTLVAKDSSIGDAMQRVIPAALTIAGFSTGTAQENSFRKKEESIEFEKAYEET